MGELLFHTAAYCLVNFLNPFFCLTLFSLHTIQNINITPSSLFQVLFFHISIIPLSNYFSNQYFVTIIKQHTINIYLLYFVIISGKFNSKETILNNNTIVFSIYISFLRRTLSSVRFSLINRTIKDYPVYKVS